MSRLLRALQQTGTNSETLPAAIAVVVAVLAENRCTTIALKPIVRANLELARTIGYLAYDSE